MKLNVKALSLTGGVIWGAAVFLVALANIAWSGYGEAFLNVIASIYPGYVGPGGMAAALIGGLYAFVDGAIGCALFGWLYNRFSGA